MKIISSAWLLPAALIGAWLLTGALRRYAISSRLMDTPNERSSHTIATPRGGGLAFAISFLLGLGVLSQTGEQSSSQLIGLGGGGAAVALIGFLDDHGHVAARWRLLAHFGAATWALIWTGTPDIVMPVGNGLTFPAWLGGLLGTLFLVWMLNLYNFMDGIDGIAGVEAICVGFGGALVAALSANPDLAQLPMLLGAGAAGFLVWNFPPARIFMGDVGSGFLGFVLGVISLQAAQADNKLFWAWLVLLGVFIVDATYTLLRRIIRGEKFYEAHRSHAYQHASRRLGQHRPVTLGVAAINVGWLLPLASLAALGVFEGWLILLTAYAPLIYLCYIFDAGTAS